MHSRVKQQRDFSRSFMLVIPGLLGFVLFYFGPLMWSVVESVSLSSFNRSFAGLKHYEYVWRNEYYLLSLKNTVLNTVFFTACCIVLALCAAAAMQKIQKSKLVLFSFLGSAFLPTAAMAIVWQGAFIQHNAVFRQWAQSIWVLGLFDMDWLCLMSLLLWRNLGVISLVLFAALESIDVSVVEAASSEGASGFLLFYYIKLPLIKPALLFAASFCVYRVLGVFREAYLLYGNYPPRTIYQVQNYMQNHFNKLNYPVLAAAALSFTALSLLLFVPFVLRKREDIV